MKIYFDDERNLPIDYTNLVKDYESLVQIYQKNWLIITEISFDFYLFGSHWTGQDALVFVLNFCKEHSVDPPRIRFHSSDRAARFRMKEILRNFYQG